MAVPRAGDVEGRHPVAMAMEACLAAGMEGKLTVEVDGDVVAVAYDHA